MKTLDEVIYWYENRKVILTGAGVKAEMEADILEYLKEYNRKLLGEQIEELTPLTWDELKQMFHQPVWIMTENKSGWNIISGIDDKTMSVIHTSHRGPKESTFTKVTIGKTWQAYRKEV